MSIDTGIFSSVIGLLKILTVVVGIVDLGLTANKYLGVSNEEYFLAIVIILFILSTVFIVLSVLGVLNENDMFIKVDFLYHVIGGLLLFIGAITWFVSVGDHGKYLWCNWKGRCNGPYIQRIFAGIIGMANAVVYFAIGALIFRSGNVLG